MKNLFNASAAIEMLTGVTLLVAPAFVIELLVGGGSSASLAAVGRVLGIALLSLGVSAWEVPGEPPRLTVRGGLCLYNVGVAGVLAFSAIVHGISGVLLWPVVGMHALLGALMLTTFPGRVGGAE